MSRFDALDYLALIDKYKATNTQVVPTMFIRLLNLPEEDRKKYDVSSLEFAIHAAAPCPISIKEQMIDWWGPILFEYYAGTENNGFVCINSDEWLEHKGSVGQIRTGVIHILDDEGNELPKGVPGTVFFEGGGSFEYYKDPEKTDQSRSKEGWSTMGDIGFLDEEDYLYLTDRKADMIISGGINIYPQEAENVLILHPKVADVAVFGIPNEEFGEEVKAVVQPVDMSEAGPELEQEIINFCQENLSKIKCPRSVDFEAELPRTEVGKLLKRVLRDRYWEGKTRTGIVVPKGD
jgi:acyl-CoA synthetase (AMP-forming)/AMP-acid ligase II